MGSCAHLIGTPTRAKVKETVARSSEDSAQPVAAAIGRSTSILFLGPASQVVLGIAQLRVLFAALTTTAEAGLFSYVTTLLNLLSTLGDFGASTIAAREVSRRPLEEGRIVSTL